MQRISLMVNTISRGTLTQTTMVLIQPYTGRPHKKGLKLTRSGHDRELELPPDKAPDVAGELRSRGHA